MPRIFDDKISSASFDLRINLNDDAVEIVRRRRKNVEKAGVGNYPLAIIAGCR